MADDVVVPHDDCAVSQDGDTIESQNGDMPESEADGTSGQRTRLKVIATKPLRVRSGPAGRHIGTLLPGEEVEATSPAEADVLGRMWIRLDAPVKGYVMLRWLQPLGGPEAGEGEGCG